MSKIATREAYGKALAELAAKDERVVVLDADLSKSTKTAEFKNVKPESFINVGIAEQNLVATAAGLAAAGKVPFASSFAMFAAGRAYEIVRNSVAYPKLNVKVAATHAGITVGEDGASHQCLEDLSLMRTIPNMVVINPADATEARAAVLKAAEYNGPVYLRFGRMGVPVVFDQETFEFEIGKGQTVIEGTDVTLIGTGIMLDAAMKAAELLKEEGISARVLNMATIKPIDTELILKAAEETKAIVTCEEHSIIGGLGSAVAEVLVEATPVPMERVGVRDVFGESGPGAELLVKYKLTAADVAEAAKKVIKRK